MLQALAPLAILMAFGQVQSTDRGLDAVHKPAPNPISWELEIDFLDPRRIEVQLPGQTETEVYWYIVYTATNPGRRSQHFFPTFQIVTEDLKVFNTDTGISPLVFDAIRERHSLTHKYLVHPTEAIGRIKSGTDNAIESVAIWRQIDLSNNSFSVYVAGLSGETRFVNNPAHDPDKPEKVKAKDASGRMVEKIVNPRHFTLRKTLEIRYTLPGSPAVRPSAAPRRSETRWIMR